MDLAILLVLTQIPYYFVVFLLVKEIRKLRSSDFLEEHLF